jgi:hypothetical protein
MTGSISLRENPLNLLRAEPGEDTTLTFDYQFMTPLAYNGDRGPVSFFSGRLHPEF